MRNFLLESNEIRFRPKKTTFYIFGNSYSDYDVIMTWKYDETINIEQNIVWHQDYAQLLQKYPTLLYKTPKIANFGPFTSCDIT